MNDWFRVATIGRLEQADRHLLECGTWRLCVVRHGEDWLVFENRCPHRGGPVGAGTIHGDLIQCPWHGQKFELTSGRCVDGSSQLTLFQTRLDADELWARPKVQADEIAGENCSWTVRYGRPGHIARFVAQDEHPFVRGQRVWIASQRGQELGEILSQEKSTSENSAASGTILRPATDEEVKLASDVEQLPAEWMEHCESLLRAKASDVTILDAERLADGNHVIVYFLGDATADLGPISVSLSASDTLVRFEAWVDNDIEGGANSQRDRDVETSSETPQEQWKREHSQGRGGLTDVFGGRAKLTSRSAKTMEIHGVYRQRKTTESQTTMMLRLRSAGGRFTTKQLSLVLRLARQFEGTIRLTGRQGIQIHGVPLLEVASTQRQLNDEWLSTQAACGDVVRSVVACPFPASKDSSRGVSQRIAREVARLFLPTSQRHLELFERHDAEFELAAGTHSHSRPTEDPLFGPTYLPHKLKIGIGCAEENCVDLFAHDAGVAITRDGSLAQLFVGGLRGDEFSGELAHSVGCVPASDVTTALKTLLIWYRDNGNREDRRRGRLRHAVAERGHEAISEAIREELGDRWTPPIPLQLNAADDHLGWSRQPDGRFTLGIPILSGRISSEDGVAQLLHQLSQTQPKISLRVTPQQNLLLCDIDDEQMERIRQAMTEQGVSTVEGISDWRRRATSCPALPSCSLATGEAERVLPNWLSDLESRLSAPLGQVGGGQVSVAGCTNGCSRPWISDIGLVAVTSTHYEVWVGGSPSRDRLAKRLLERLAASEVVSTITALYNQYSSRAASGESLGDFCHRVGVEELRKCLRASKKITSATDK